MKKSEIYRLAAIAVAAADNELIGYKVKTEVMAYLAREQYVSRVMEDIAEEKAAKAAAEAEKAEEKEEENA